MGQIIEYQKSTASGSKDIEIKPFEFVAKVQFLQDDNEKEINDVPLISSQISFEKCVSKQQISL